MRAIQLEKPKRLRMVEVAEAREPGEGEALVAVHRVGICGTDIAGYLGKMPFFSYPRIPGHELGVEVLSVGKGVRKVKVGDKCSVEPYMNCGKCFACKRGATNCCEALEVLGVMTDGGMRERFVVRADKLHVSDDLSYEQLALVETLSIGCHAVDRAEVEEGDNVLVIGAGPIGLSAIEFVKLMDARLLVMDMAESRLAFCRDSMDVDLAFKPGGDPATTQGMLREYCGGELPRVVIDATGHAGSMGESMWYAAHTGRVVYVGITADDVVFSDRLFHRREITLMGSRNSLPRDFARIIGLIEQGKIDTRPWITHRTGFDELVGRFEGFTKRENGAIKAVVELT